MIGYLKGKVISYSEDAMVILENNGVGFEVACSASAFNSLVEAGEGEVFVYTAVREDGIFLYGFSNREEKEMFLKLITVSSIGPKMGITILSQMGVKELSTAIATENVKMLAQVKGLGKKTAERIILELKEKVLIADIILPVKADVPRLDDSIYNDALNALLSLGFTKQESDKAIKTATDSGEKTLEKIIAYAIKHIR